MSRPKLCHLVTRTTGAVPRDFGTSVDPLRRAPPEPDGTADPERAAPSGSAGLFQRPVRTHPPHDFRNSAETENQKVGRHSARDGRSGCVAE